MPPARAHFRRNRAGRFRHREDRHLLHQGQTENLRLDIRRPSRPPLMPFELDTFIADCLAAVPDQAAVAEIVQRAVSAPTMLEATFTRKLDQSNLGILHYSDKLTVQHVVFPPAYRTGVHDHLTCAVIGTWGGYEDNHLFAREGNRAVQISVERCEPGQVRS